MRIIQFTDRQGESRVGIVEENRINILNNTQSVYELFTEVLKDEPNIPEAVQALASGRYEEYQALIDEKRVLLPLTHPDPYHTWIAGTGLTHLGSASARDAMHQKIEKEKEEKLSDSLKMFRMGVEHGKMTDGKPASQPEWFYKGNGLMAVPPEHPLSAPSFAHDGGEEPELAGIYIVDSNGNPRRIGFALGNEFSDHKMESINYLYLAHSKLRPCSYGPELLLGELPGHVTGTCRIRRDNRIVWEKEFLTGEDNMSHNFANLEHHHFKYELFRQPGDVHIHFFGTAVLSYADQVEVEDGDRFEIESEIFGKALRNPVKQL